MSNADRGLEGTQGDAGEDGVYATEIGALCETRSWTRARLVFELRKAARERGEQLPDDDSLRRMVREWNAGRRGLSPLYAQLLSAVFGVTVEIGKAGDPSDRVTEASELDTRLQASSQVDAGLVGLLEDQTQSLRLLDRRLGAVRLLAQTELHLTQIGDLLTYTLPGGQREPLAAAAAEAAALAGWQALDLGDPAKAWQHHETAKNAARESESASILAHVTAQQGYALLDRQRSAEAVQLMRYAREAAAGKVPALLMTWLLAAEAESLAAIGDNLAARRALDDAAGLLPEDSTDPDLPFVILDAVHLGRWRGHCLARLGATEAVEELSDALSRLDSTFARAAAGLRTDLALAHSMRGEHKAAHEHAQAALDLATLTASERQKRRLRLLLASGERLDR